MSPAIAIGLAALAGWIYLLAARGFFWQAGPEDESPVDGLAPSDGWPKVVAVIPARDEADVVGETVASLLTQDYPGQFRLVLVDDQSSDGTAEVARAAALRAGAADRLTVLQGQALPRGWTGKLWAIAQGIAHGQAAEPDYLWLSDADIAYAPDTLRRLASRAEAEGLVLYSLMAKLHCRSFAERMLIPAFIFFFRMLYPFAWVSSRTRRLAAAAGGCMLVRRRALVAADGIESIRGELIDDCALARRLKTQGPIRLDLTERARSIRPYPGIDPIRRMVARSAYAQLRFSSLLLAGTLLGMGLLYLAPPTLGLFAGGTARMLGLAGWLAMAFAFRPTLAFYRVSPLWGLAMPAIAALYLLFTLDSARQYRLGRGGFWKGRAQAPGSEAA
ncbi:MAG TPA: glycosyltransferase [Candidatus Udaeobacter sp.]|nr:glycosyltransferase [Candidatus Udaeobacter sp.]